MPVTRMLLALLSVALVAGLMTAACGDDDDDDSENATTPASGGAEPTAGESEVCDAAGNFRSSITTLAQSASADELKDNAATARERAQDLRKAVTDARLDGRETIEDSLNEFTSDIEDASSGDRPLAGTIAAVAEAVLKVQDQVTNIEAEGGCD